MVDTIPQRIKTLPRNEKGYPIPFFVEKTPTGQPVDFRVTSPTALAAAIRRKVCWICGQPLGRYSAFVGGPLVAGQRLSGEPPSHRDCAIYAATACPFLSRPHAERRDDETAVDVTVAANQVAANPQVAAVCTVSKYELSQTEDGLLFDMVGDVEINWFRCGRAATRTEVLDAIELARTNFLAQATGPGLEQQFAKIEERLRAQLPHD